MTLTNRERQRREEHARDLRQKGLSDIGKTLTDLQLVRKNQLAGIRPDLAARTEILKTPILAKWTALDAILSNLLEAKRLAVVNGQFEIAQLIANAIAEISQERELE